MIKNKLIKDFIKVNKRAPRRNEINVIYNNFIEENKKAEEVGLLAGKQQDYFIAGSESSSSKYNDFIEQAHEDLKSLLSKIEKESKDLEDTFRIYSGRITNSFKELQNLEREVNKDLLLHSKSDIYNYGIVESFNDYSKIDMSKSNIYLFNGRLTVGFEKVSGGSFNQGSTSYYVRHRGNGKLRDTPYNDFSNAFKEDGTFFKVVSYSKYEDETVDFIVETSFSEDKGKSIGTIKFITDALEMNSKQSYTALYSKDGSNFFQVFESDLRITDGENYIEVNQDNVKKLRLIITKRGYDLKVANDYGYVFSLDFFGYTTTAYKINEESIAYLGPYEILDENAQPVNFNLATIKGGTCCVVPDKTSVDIYLSKDNYNWLKADFNGESRQVIQFGETESDIFDIVDSESTLGYLAETVPNSIVLKNNEKLLNYYIKAENKEMFIKESLSIKRNVLSDKDNKTYKASSGWEFDGSRYSTTIEILQPEGRYINLGNASCLLNGRIVNGKVFLTFGKHKFQTSKENWIDLDVEEKSIQSLRQLRSLDRLYPYNHKYIIEGFNYSDVFRGVKEYIGVDKVYAHDLKEVSNQKFLTDTDFSIYTIIETADGLYFKVKNKPSVGDSKLEEFEITCKTRVKLEENNNLLYIKAVLKTFDRRVTPKIDQIQVRVI